ncbi:MAG: L-serine ammonia-lyase, iron-sulfur-dependent, subunit alpha, partial [Sneathiella sp.]|nr:L-serine ammonia-lyase, iron-sulfur-dependent, subunit alpha [Sneathiella sp.]
MPLSLLNSIVGPVMRGPSSSHAAAPFFIGTCCRQLSCGFGEKLYQATIIFDPTGTFAPVYQNQGSDQGFAAGLSGIAMTDKNYRDILPACLAGENFQLTFEVAALEQMTHPNRVDLFLQMKETDGTNRTDHYKAISTGGGMFEIFELNGTPLLICGDTALILVKGDIQHSALPVEGQLILAEKDGYHQIIAPKTSDVELLREWKHHSHLEEIRFCQATQYSAATPLPPLTSTEVVLTLSQEHGDLAKAALWYEANLLEISIDEAKSYFLDRAARMLQSVEEGLSSQNDNQRMKYMPATASKVHQANLPPSLGGELLQTAIAGAIAVMERNAVRGIVAAAPTAGSAGIVPGCLYGLKKVGFSEDELADALAVMALIGTVYGERATFAAECGGCQVETGAAAAMAAG